MGFTPEQKAAQRHLQDAIEAHAAAFAPPGGDGLVVDWAAVIQLSSFDADGDRVAAYHLAYAGGQMDDHRAVGLFNWGVHLLMYGGPGRGVAHAGHQ